MLSASGWALRDRALIKRSLLFSFLDFQIDSFFSRLMSSSVVLKKRWPDRCFLLGMVMFFNIANLDTKSVVAILGQVCFIVFDHFRFPTLFSLSQRNLPFRIPGYQVPALVGDASQSFKQILGVKTQGRTNLPSWTQSADQPDEPASPKGPKSLILNSWQ